MIAVKVKDYAHFKVHAIDINSSLFEAAEIMYGYNIGALVVEEEGEHVGIFTERDFLSASFNNQLDLKDVTIAKYCTKPVVSINQEDTLGQATQMMLAKHIRRLAVTDDSGSIIGFCSMRDVLKATHNTFLSLLNA